MGHLISIAKWPISLRHHHCSLFQEPSSAFWRPGHGAISCSYFQHQCLQMENVCCFGREMSTILDRRCKQKITSEPNRNESGIDWWQPRLIKKECVCVCLIDALILSHSGNGPWVGLPNGTQIFTMDTNIFVSTSMQAWAWKVRGKTVQVCDTVQWYHRRTGYFGWVLRHSAGLWTA